MRYSDFVITCPARWTAALERLRTLGLAHAAILAWRADAGVVDLGLAAPVSEAQSAGTAEVDSVAFGYGTTGSATHAWRADARVRKLTSTSSESILASEGSKMRLNVTSLKGSNN